MTTETDIVEQLNAAATLLPANSAAALREGAREIERLRVVLSERAETIRTLVDRSDRAEKLAGSLSQKNDTLLDDLNRLSLENARLEGYQDRVREFDPVSDRQLYRDQAHPIMMRPPETLDGAGDMSAVYEAAGFGRGNADRPAPWYRRR